MVRLTLLALALLATPALGQDTASTVDVGTRVRVFLSPDALPPRGAVFTGSLLAYGDTLVVGTDGGSTIRVAPADLSGFDIYAGRRSYPYWLPAVGAAAGLAVGYPVGRIATTSERCPPIGNTCRKVYDVAKTRTIAAVGLTAGGLLAAYAGRVLASEQWERRSVRAVPTGSGVAVTVRL